MVEIHRKRSATNVTTLSSFRKFLLCDYLDGICFVGLYDSWLDCCTLLFGWKDKMLKYCPAQALSWSVKICNHLSSVLDEESIKHGFYISHHLVVCYINPLSKVLKLSKTLTEDWKCYFTGFNSVIILCNGLSRTFSTICWQHD